MSCVYTYKGVEYSEKEFKALVINLALGGELNTQDVVNRIVEAHNEDVDKPSMSNLRREEAKEEKKVSVDDDIDMFLSDLLGEEPSKQFTDTYPFRTVKGNVKKIVKALKNIAPNLTITIVSDSEYRKKAVDSGMSEKDAKRSAAFYDALTDSIVINRAAAIANTLTHEAAHPVISAALAARPEIAEKFSKEIADLQTPNGNTYREWAETNYPSPFTEHERQIEMLCEFLSNVAVGEHSDIAGRSAWEYIKDLINSLLSTLGVELSEPLNTEEDVIAFAKQFASSLRTGRTLLSEKMMLKESGIVQQRVAPTAGKIGDKIVELLSQGKEGAKEAVIRKFKGDFQGKERLNEIVLKETGKTLDEYVDLVISDYEASILDQAKEEKISSLPNKNSVKTRAKAFLNRVLDAKNITASEKKQLESDFNRYYESLTYEEMEDIGRAFIEELGGLENAIKEVNSNTKILPLIKVHVLGQAINEAKRKQDAALSENDKDKAADSENTHTESFVEAMNKYGDTLDQTLREYGQAIAYMNKMYANSPLAIERRLRKENDELNAKLAPRATEKANKIVDIAKSNEQTSSSLEEAFDEHASSIIAAQEKRIKELETLISEKKKGKSNTGKKKFTKEGLRKLFKESFGYANANANPKMVELVGYAAGYVIQEGYTKAKDFYKAMHELLEGKGRELYEEAYKKAVKDFEGVDISSDSELSEAFAEYEELAKELDQKKAQVEKDKKVKAFGRLLSHTLADKKARKSKEQNLRERATELDTLFNTDQFTKQVEDYLEGKRVDKLTTESNVNKAIREGMIEAGYYKEVGGKKVVDWDGVAKSGKTPQGAWAKVDEVLKNTLSPSDYAIQSQLLRDLFFAKVNEKKAKAIEKELSRLSKLGLPKNKAKRKSRIQKLLELENVGALDNKKVQELLASELGLRVITDDQWKEIRRVLAAIERAPSGAELEKLEEELQYNILKAKPMFWLLKFSENNRLRMLAGFITNFKNATGIFSSANASVQKILANNASKTSDKEIFKVVAEARKVAVITMMDVLRNGGVDYGSAFSEMTGTKEGTPRVRAVEYTGKEKRYVEFGNRMVDVYKLARLYNKLDKGVSRTLSGMDVLNSVTLAEIGTYDFLKRKVKQENPSWSNKEVSEEAYRLMHYEILAEAEVEVEKEFEDRGIEITDSAADQARFKRRVYEYVQQMRDKEAVAVGSDFAGRYTFKHKDMGITHPARFIYTQAMNALAAASVYIEKTLPNKTGVYTARSVKALVEIMKVMYLPFVQGPLNIIEKGLEYTPYGFAKSAVYYAASAPTTDTTKKIVLKSRAGEYAFRATYGTVLAAILIGMIADKDEEGLPMIYAQGSTSLKDNQVENALRPKNSIVINGHAISVEYFGAYSIMLKAMGAYYDMKRERIEASALKRKELDSALYAGSIGFVASILSDTYFTGISRAASNIAGTNPVRREEYIQEQAAGLIARTFIPATNFFKQTGDLFATKAVDPNTLWQSIVNQAGMAVLVDNKRVDVLGREYDAGDLYPSSPRGFLKMFKQREKDSLMQFIDDNSKEGVSPTATPAVTNGELTLRDKNLNPSDMNEEQYSEFVQLKSKKFGEKVQTYYNTNPEERYALTTPKMPKLGTKEYDNLQDEAVEQLKLEGKTVNVDTDGEVIEDKMMEILAVKHVRTSIYADIKTLNDNASEEAFIELCEKWGYFVPFHIQSSSMKSQKENKKIIGK